MTERFLGPTHTVRPRNDKPVRSCTSTACRALPQYASATPRYIVRRRPASCSLRGSGATMGSQIIPTLGGNVAGRRSARAATCGARSEEHTSELQSLRHLVCRLLLEKKKNKEKIKTVSSIQSST